MLVQEVRKSESFSNEKPFAVVRFVKGTKGGSKFRAGSLADSVSYSLTYNLSQIYTAKDNENLWEGGEFNAKAAFKLFREEMPAGYDESEVQGYDILVSEISDFEAVIITKTKVEMQVLHPACYGTREDALRIAKRSLQRQLAQKLVVPVGTAIEDKDEDEDDD